MFAEHYGWTVDDVDKLTMAQAADLAVRVRRSRLNQ